MNWVAPGDLLLECPRRQSTTVLTSENASQVYERSFLLPQIPLYFFFVGVFRTVVSEEVGSKCARGVPNLRTKKRSLTKYFETSPEIIRLAVMLYVRFPLLRRNVEDLLHERGIEVSH